jgi:hypothetical protein
MQCGWETRGGDGGACSWLAVPGEDEFLGYGGDGRVSLSRWSGKPPYQPGRRAEDETVPDLVRVLEARRGDTAMTLRAERRELDGEE